jgi:hypothetical protein
VEKAADAAPSQRRKADLQEILGHTPEASSTPFFGFAGDAEPPSAPPLPKPPAPSPSSAGTAPAGRAPTPTPAAAPPPTAARAAAPAPLPPASTGRVAPAASAQNGSSSADHDEGTHWREVYEQYIATRKQCGEAVDNLSFEKFGVTLRKTRDQLVEKHGAVAVRFSVQIKEGKAALKAQPVK